MANIELNYITFDQLLASVAVDLRTLEEEGQIEPGQLIKVARRVNYDLGLRIHKTRQTIIDIDNGYGKLPEDFYILDYALLLGKYKEIIPEDWKGRVTENVNVPCPTVPPISNCPCWTVYNPNMFPVQVMVIYCDSTTAETTINPGTTQMCANQIGQDPLSTLTITTDHFCAPTGVLNEWTCDVPPACNTCSTTDTAIPHNTCTPEEDPFFERGQYSICSDSNCVIVKEQKFNRTREYEWVSPLYIKSQTYIDPAYMSDKLRRCAYTGEIKNGYLYTSIKCAKCFITYQGDLVDEDGNLLVLDHPEIRTYYEDSLKYEIFKNLWYNGEEVEKKMQYAEQQMKQSRVRSLSIVNTPNFSEMYQTHLVNRRMQERRYYDTFVTNVFHQRWKSGVLF